MWYRLQRLGRLASQNDRVAALALAGDCLDLLRSRDLSYEMVTGCLRAVADVYERNEDWEAALPLREENWLIEQGRDRPDAAAVIVAMEYVATDARRLNDLERASQLQRRALDHWRTAEGLTSLRACRSEAQLGITLQTMDLSAEARPLLEHALEFLSDDEPLMPGTYSRLASALSRLGEREEAVRVATQGVALLLSTYGSHDPRTFQQRENLAVFQWNVGNRETAHRLLTDVLSANQKLHESEQRDLFRAQEWLDRLDAEIKE